jgi:hypothetical protein
MNIADIIIIYLAFGSPLMVYRYLVNRDLERSRRILIALLTLACWIPMAARLGYRYLTNAYFGKVFVSRRTLDAVNGHLAEIRCVMKSELMQANASVSMRELSEILERYVGLTVAIRDASTGKYEKSLDLFVNAGKERELVTRSLISRNRGRLGRHHIRARRDLLDLFERLLDRYPTAQPAIELVVKIAHQLGDDETADFLKAVEESRGPSWNPEQHHSILDNTSAPLRHLAVKTSPLNSD